MRRICVMAAICLTILFQSSAIGETELFFEGSDKNSAAYQKFVKSHPECIVNTETNIYRSTNEIISALLTGEFPCDMLRIICQNRQHRLFILANYAFVSITRIRECE